MPRIAFSNGRGLPLIYNAAIEEASTSECVLFVHDDVWFDDFFLVDHVHQGLQAFDVIGVAGNRQRRPRQPGWAFASRASDGRFVWDDKALLSGTVAHGRTPFGRLSRIGPSGVGCEPLDGVFLAARRSTLLGAGVRFDPRFAFHFYDLDFCRSARHRELSLGTWPVALTHQSGDAFGSAAWEAAWKLYLEKWGD
ncbi:MAG: hypothetical protein Fur0019_01200 [Tibeticola sp.]